MMAAPLKALTREMWSSRNGLRGFIVSGLLLEIAVVSMAVAYPVALKGFVDDVTAGEGPLAILIAVLLVSICWAGPNFVGAIRHLCTTRICGRMAEILGARSLAVQLPHIATSGRAESGALLGALERLPFSLQMVVEGLFWQVMPLVGQFLVSLAIICLVAPPVYTGLTAGLLTLVLACAYQNGRKWSAYSAGANAAAGMLSGTQADIARNARRIVFNGNLASEVSLVANLYSHRRKAAEAGDRSLIRFSLVQNLILGFGVVLIFGFCAGDIRAGRLTMGTFILIQSYIFRLTQPAGALVFLVLQAGVAIENIRAILALAAGAEPDRCIAPVPPTQPVDISLEGLSFSYGAGVSQLTDINLNIARGSFTAIVGPSGAGKSTLAQLIAGLKEPSRGKVQIGGRDLAEVALSDRPGHILYVPQFISLFDRTLRDNLLYHPSRQSEAEAAGLLAEWRFSTDDSVPDLEAFVGEMGERLSGGQVQKVEFARVLGIEVPAIIFDESSSSLDPMSERQVLHRIRSDFLLRTTVMFVTHRLTIAENADQVIFLKEGQVRACGSHADLLRDYADYRHLWTERDAHLD